MSSRRPGGLSRGTAFFVVVAQLALGAAVHHHSSSLFENLRQEDEGFRQEVHEIACRTPLAIHWHADKTVEIEPCFACLRQHLVGIQVHPPSHPGLRIVERAASNSRRCAVRGVSLDLSSRGPPVLL